MCSRLLLLVLAVAVASCSSWAPPATMAGPSSSAASASALLAASPTRGPVDSSLLASVESRGGLCPAATCDQTVYLDRGGRIHISAKPPNDLGTATRAQVHALEAAITAADFASLRRPAFSGECPTAFDGQELVFEFATGTGTERLASCETALDYGTPLFRALADALGKASPFEAR